MTARLLDWMIARGWSDHTIANLICAVPFGIGVAAGLAFGWLTWGGV